MTNYKSQWRNPLTFTHIAKSVWSRSQGREVLLMEPPVSDLLPVLKGARVSAGVGRFGITSPRGGDLIPGRVFGLLPLSLSSRDLGLWTRLHSYHCPRLTHLKHSSLDIKMLKTL